MIGHKYNAACTLQTRRHLEGRGMTPEEVLEHQIERYRGMTGEQRLQIALDLHALSCDVAREGIRHQFPNADEAEVDRLLRQRLGAVRS